MNVDYVVNIAAGYLLGSVPFGLVIGYIWLRRDIRKMGSGKTGTTNVLRTAGKLPAALVVIGDISKGTVPALLGRFLFDDAGVAAAGAAAAIGGHIWPVFAGFRGGRGVATAFGGVLGLTPLVALAFPVLAAIVLLSTRYVSLMSITVTPLAALIVLMGAIAGWQPWPYVVYVVIAVALIEYMHIPNMRRLIARTEPKIGRGGSSPATG
ncbi:MAG: glycerol-3-phosphate 1-O-acyltransferase PlsY [Dehalococcoidia bacterium]